ncbi:MAG: nitroreductase family protein [Planctomycetota bacterium]|nr:nitroreductase family protein [Planctomycetota bacterium]
MNRRTFLKSVPAMAALAAAKSGFSQDANTFILRSPTENRASSSTKELQPIALLKPETDGGKSVLAALKERRTIRNIKSEKLPPQMLSNLLWAAFGVNRQNSPFGQIGRTAASASNSQEIDLYVALPEGVYLYEVVGHHLTPVVAGDFRARSGRGRGSAGATPVNIFYVVDLTRYSLGQGQPDRRIGDPEVQKSYYYTATGLIAGNVYLFAASQGLAAWFHNCDKENTAREFKLRPEQRVLFAQTVGYPA